MTKPTQAQAVRGLCTPEQHAPASVPPTMPTFTTARALAATLEGVASLVSTDERAGSFQHTDDLSSLLFNLHNQLNTIAGLSDLADEANYRVRRALKGGAQ